MTEGDDLVRADMWASMSFRPGLSDDEVVRKFKDLNCPLINEDWKL